MSLSDWCLMFRHNVVVSSSRFKKVHDDSDNIHGNFNPWRWDHHVVLKCWVPITQWHGSTLQKNYNPMWSVNCILFLSHLTSSMQYTGTFRFVPTSLRLHIYTTEYFNTCREWTDRLIKTNITDNIFFVHLFYSALCIIDYMLILGGPVDDKLDRIWK